MSTLRIKKFASGSKAKSDPIKLRDEDRDTYFRMNSKHDPLQKIPTELVAYIFEQTLDDYICGALQTPLRLGRVCRYWRQVAWATPSLWKKLSFALNPASSNQGNQRALSKQCLDIFQSCLRRSGGLPLAISILYNWEDEAVEVPSDVVMPLLDAIAVPTNISRIVHLHLDVPIAYLAHLNGISAPSLTTFSFNEPGLNPSNPHLELTQLVTQLENLTLNSNSLLIHLSNISCPKLLYLEAHNCDAQHVIHLMRQASALRKCICELIGEFPPATLQTRSVLAQLEYLEVCHPDSSGDAKFLKHFTLPGLRHLVMHPQSDGQDFLSFIARSQCRLTTLDLSGYYHWTISELESALISLPKLSILRLRNTLPTASMFEVFRALFASASQSNEDGHSSINYFECNIYWKASDAWDLIPECLRSAVQHRRKSSMQVNLFVLESQHEIPWMPMDLIRTIRELEKQGWKWTISVDGFKRDVKNFIEASLSHHYKNISALLQ